MKLNILTAVLFSLITVTIATPCAEPARVARDDDPNKDLFEAVGLVGDCMP